MNYNQVFQQTSNDQTEKSDLWERDHKWFFFLVDLYVYIWCLWVCWSSIISWLVFTVWLLFQWMLSFWNYKVQACFHRFFYHRLLQVQVWWLIQLIYVNILTWDWSIVKVLSINYHLNSLVWLFAQIWRKFL